MTSSATAEAKREKPSTQDHEDTQEAKLASNGRWAAAITLMCYFYGDLTISSTMPKDPRQSDWLSTKTPLPALFSCLAYVFIVTWWGPRFMRNREPVKGLRHLMMFYNAFQVVFNSYIFYQGGMNGWFGTYAPICETCTFTNQPKSLGMLDAAYWYYISKFVDFIDTFFFVVHKKYNHISLLHVSHHALMPISTWFGVVYQPGGHATFMGFINAFVHVLMYSYYLLAAMGPKVRPYLWWKKYLTTIQMIQFIAMFLHSMVILIVSDCNVPHQFARWVGSMSLVFQFLFMDFYIKAYRKKGASLLVCKLDNDLLKRVVRENYNQPVQANGIKPEAHTGAICKVAPQKLHSEEDSDIANSIFSLRYRVAAS
ncbi:Elongation of very long chain fatty acids protein 7 [Halocaridina rubra]|uniref:Elongation of very long chain fatty acids protein n=1 Tax=Halocaridina rubra TaxID=373956 RepID=A0AAN8ZZG0_HALRR